MADLARVFPDLVRYETRLYHALNDRLRAEHGLTAGQFLRAIADDDGCRVGDLAAGFAITTGAASKNVDRLEAAGWTRRAPHPSNRRSSVLALTDTGRAVLDAATPTFDEVLRTWLAGPLGSRALASLGAVLAQLREAIETAGLGSPAG